MICVLNLPLFSSGAYPHGEHIYSITSSQWALSGALFARHGGKTMGQVRPLELGTALSTVYALLPLEARTVDGGLHLYDGARCYARLLQGADGVWIIERGEEGLLCLTN